MTEEWQEEELTSHYFPETKKEGRKMRKIASRTDRSKFKKTDRDKQKATEVKEGTERGRVLSIPSDEISVDVKGTVYRCTLRGVLKKDRTKKKNIVVVGDFVQVEILSDETGVIDSVDKRASFLSRAESLKHQKEQLIAANIDQVLITVSVVDPLLRPSLVDRYIIATVKGNMQPIIVVNKIDLLSSNEEEMALLETFEKAYGSLGFTLIKTCAETGEGLDQLKEVMKDRSSVFSGQSGVGKSSLINSITGLHLQVGETVSKTKKGAHTTTTANLIPLSFGGFCIDTPGIKSFGMWDIEVTEIQEHFPDIFKFKTACRYPNCIHIHEPECAVKEAIEKGSLHKIRYDSYQALVKTLEEEHRNR